MIRTGRLFIILLAVLVIVYNGECKPYKGGELRTIASYTYGRFEVRMKSAAGSGVVSSFFTYHDNDPQPVEHWNEIDIEILGRYLNRVQFNTITPGIVHHVYSKTVGFNPHEDFHIYAIEWTPNYVAWFIDGAQVHMQYGTHIAELNLPQKIMMNLYPPGSADWAGEWDDSILPVYAFYDWVRFYSYDPDSGNYGTGDLFRFSWEDDFEAWDITRWQKATHTFDGNNADFIPENVVFYQGYMILCLTTPGDTGYPGGPVSIDDRNSPITDYSLIDIYPNPFNVYLRIRLEGPNRISDAEIRDVSGRRVKRFDAECFNNSDGEIIWNGRDDSGRLVSSGIYLIVLRSEASIIIDKAVLLK